MKRSLVLNEYEEKALMAVTQYVLLEKHDEFKALVDADGITYESLSDLVNVDFLRFAASSTIKDHIYYKALVLNSELKESVE